MKYKILFFAIMAFMTYECSAYKLVIRKETVGGDGSGNYNYVNRNVKDITVDIEGVTALQARIIEIGCEGVGPNACPNNIAYNGSGNEELPSISELFTLEAINAAQALLNNADIQSSSGQGSGGNNGTIITPDGKSYIYSITWHTSALGVTNINMIFEDAQ